MPAFIDITGQVFNRLTVIKRSDFTKKKHVYWDCLCICGAEVSVEGSSLKSGNTESCGCLSKERASQTHLKPLTGKVFGRLVVTGRAPVRDGDDGSFWECECVCGNRSRVARSSLINEKTTSCGCLRDERVSQTHTTHGNSRDPLYSVWSGMVDRCTNPKCKGYKNYGGRGISVCGRWLTSVQHFIDDLGDPPTSAHTLERQNNDKGYSPCNVYWATWLTQANNKRTNRALTYLGKTLNMTQWSKEIGISTQTISARLKRGWTIEETLTLPVSWERKVVSPVRL